MLGYAAPAQAGQPVAPFGIPSDSVGVNGIAYATPQAGNTDGNEFFVTFLDDVIHQYPSGTNNPPLNFNVPDWAWPFFVQHPRQ